MSGPIVRTGATPEYWQNWDNIFGKKSKGTESKAQTPDNSEGNDKSSKKKSSKKKDSGKKEKK